MLNTLLSKLRILDEQGNLSLTNIGVMVLIVKIALSSPIDWPTTASLMLALLAYRHKKHVAKKAVSANVAADSKVTELAAKVEDLVTMVNIKRL